MAESFSEYSQFQESRPIDNLLSVPVMVEETGLSSSMLEDIVARQLLESGVVDLSSLSHSTALASRVVQTVLEHLRADARIEVLGSRDGSASLRYSLTDAGRKFAADARGRSTYIGPAPVSESQYRALINEQSVHDLKVTQVEIREAYRDVVIKPQLQDKLGAAMHSGKAMFIYGPAGTGKTFLCSRLIRLLQTPVFIPHAIAIGDSIVRVYDGAVHEAIESAGSSTTPWIADRVDPRFVYCKRPFIVSGGELTLDLLEIRRDDVSGQYIAPLQMKATHGIYMIDDLGRQKMSTDALFNRWIVPMESGVDYLNLDSGGRLELPFDVILIFSTNLQPEDVSDPAFQRRIGHKIGFEYCDEQSYAEIWRQECLKRGVECDDQLIHFAIHDLHGRHGRPMLACHPRDLIGMTLDFSRFTDGYDRLSFEGLEMAWDNLFCIS